MVVVRADIMFSLDVSVDSYLVPRRPGCFASIHPSYNAIQLLLLRLKHSYPHLLGVLTAVTVS